MRKVILLAAAAIILVACNPCKPGTQRCTGSIVEICRPDKKWHKVQDCSKLKRTKKLHKCTCELKDGQNKCYCCPQEGVKSNAN
jgi:hypothetical protein